MRFQAYGWHTQSIDNGNHIVAIAVAIEAAQKDPRPSLILVHTHIGYGSPKKQDNFSAHGNPLGEEELQATKKALGWPTMDKFYLPQDAVDFYRQAIAAGAQAEDEWKKKFEAYRKEFPKEA